MPTEIKAVRTPSVGRPRARFLLWPLVILFGAVEFLLDITVKIFSVLHKSFETLTLVLLNIANEPARSKPNP